MANGQWGGIKTVVLDDAVSSIVGAQCQVYPRFQEAWDALEWLLARSASNIGRASNGGELRLYVQADDPIANVPAIWVIYRVGEEIEILAVNIAPPVVEEEEA